MKAVSGGSPIDMAVLFQVVQSYEPPWRASGWVVLHSELVYQVREGRTAAEGQQDSC